MGRVILWMVGCLLLFQTCCSAEMGFDSNFPPLKDKESYDVVLQTGEASSIKISNVKILGMTKIDNRSFLIVQPQSSPTSDSGLVDFEAVRSILPAGMIS